MRAVLLSPDSEAQLSGGKFITSWSFNKNRSIFPGKKKFPLLVTGAWSQLIKNHHFNPQSKCASVYLEQNANFQLHSIIWDSRTQSILILKGETKQDKTQACIFSYIQDPSSFRDCLPGHTHLLVRSSSLLPWAGSADWPDTLHGSVAGGQLE